jgi:hypothetical protein
MSIYKDLVVKTGTFTNREGEEKNRYENIGTLVEKDDGGRFIMLKRTFNIAGVPNPEDRDTIVVSIFSKDGKEAASNGNETTNASNDIGSDDIPF